MAFSMQETRRLILEIIKRRGQVTVDDIVDELQRRRGTITAVTVRHHLKLLQQEELIDCPELRRRNSPGRPQHVYTLTEKARVFFPNNFERLASGLLQQIRLHLPDDGVNVILEGVADHLAGDLLLPDSSFEQRLDLVVDHLNEHGYDAFWECAKDGGYLLHTSNCPYHQMAVLDEALCSMDMRLVSVLLGVVPRRTESVVQGDERCSYYLPAENGGRLVQE
ncbi:MAG: hypothetical protein L6Q98_07715 [Anaerolineae bacterium]|nr:hypothetical protein [Anaerolineae bacterium]NUQ02480.1 hypothetical protein [Anaerolineae bacterium]